MKKTKKYVHVTMRVSEKMSSTLISHLYGIKDVYLYRILPSREAYKLTVLARLFGENTSQRRNIVKRLKLLIKVLNKSL